MLLIIMHPHVTAQTPPLSGERDFSQVFQTPSEVRDHLARRFELFSCVRNLWKGENVFCFLDVRMYAVNRACLKEPEMDTCRAKRKANYHRWRSSTTKYNLILLFRGRLALHNTWASKCFSVDKCHFWGFFPKLVWPKSPPHTGDLWCLLIFLWKRITSQLTGTLGTGGRHGSGQGGAFPTGQLLGRLTEMSVSGRRYLKMIRERLQRLRSGRKDSSVAEIHTDTPNPDVLQKTSDNTVEISRFIQRHWLLARTMFSLLLSSRVNETL